MANGKSISAVAFMASFTGGPQCAKSKPSAYKEDSPVSTNDSFIGGQWRVIATWPDGTLTMHPRNTSICTRQNGVEYLEAQAETNETPEQRNRRKVAGKLARVMREAGISANAARQGGLHAIGERQELAQKCFRRAVAAKARCQSGYVPSDATFELACSMLEVL